ncbi:MAG: NUDIX hydrolase [Holosporales bacterium]|jgi:8-oxo-dGTP pyrophosphatase MutT (NUDIX family)|nr:NUDIX hydrolase [Holosporales bacterium]
MHRNLAIELINNYAPTDQVELEDKRRMLDFLAREPDCFDRNCVEGHFTASCWLENYAGDAILLTHHRKFGKWIQLGGHADGDSDLLRVSLKEAYEESGLSNIEPVRADIFDIGVHFIPPHEDITQHYHYDVRFYLKAMKDEPFTVSEESHDLKWVFLHEKEKLPDNHGVQRMFAKWEYLKTAVS